MISKCAGIYKYIDANAEEKYQKDICQTTDKLSDIGN